MWMFLGGFFLDVWVRVEVGVKVEVLKLEKFKKKLKSQEMRFPKSKTTTLQKLVAQSIQLKWGK